MVQITSNILVIAGTILFAFIFLATGAAFLAKAASTMVLSAPDQASRDLAAILVISKGVPGEIITNYTIPKVGVDETKFLSFEVHPSKLRVSKDQIITTDSSSNDMDLPEIEYPPLYYVLKIPNRLYYVNNKIEVNAESGHIKNICQWNLVKGKLEKICPKLGS